MRVGTRAYLKADTPRTTMHEAMCEHARLQPRRTRVGTHESLTADTHARARPEQFQGIQCIRLGTRAV
jgi:hypothetical protein